MYKKITQDFGKMLTIELKNKTTVKYHFHSQN